MSLQYGPYGSGGNFSASSYGGEVYGAMGQQTGSAGENSGTILTNPTSQGCPTATATKGGGRKQHRRRNSRRGGQKQNKKNHSRRGGSKSRTKRSKKTRRSKVTFGLLNGARSPFLKFPKTPF